jgi:hypothetical protein
MARAGAILQRLQCGLELAILQRLQAGPGPPCTVFKIAGARAGAILQSLQIGWARAGHLATVARLNGPGPGPAILSLQDWMGHGLGHLATFARLAGPKPGSATSQS